MNFNFSTLDVFLIFAFFIFNCAVAFSTRSIVRDFDSYASGQNENYSGLSIISSIIALACSASMFFIGMPTMCKGGFTFIWMYFFTEVICALLIIFLYIPKIININTYSLQEYISRMYNDDKTIRFVFAFCEIVQRIGRFAAQISIVGILAQNIFELRGPNNTFLYLLAALLILYSCFGGLKAVTHTDVIQSLIFLIIIPMISLLLWYKTADHSGFYNILNGEVTKFKASEVISSRENMLIAISALLNSAIGWGTRITSFQRIRMCKTTKTAQKLWGIGMVIYLMVIATIVFISLQIAGLREFNIGTKEGVIVKYMLELINNHTVALLFFFAIVSLAISTADSEFNCITVLLGNDIFIGKLKKWYRNKFVGNIVSTIVSFIALLLSLNSKNLFALYMSVSNVYLPIAGVPLLLSILGFKTYLPAIKIGSATGFITTAITYGVAKYIDSKFAEFSFGVGIFANIAAMILVHYYYKNVLKQQITCVTQEDIDSINDMRKNKIDDTW